MRQLGLAVALLAASAITPVQAAIVTFDDTAGTNQSGYYGSGDSFTDQGLTFTYSGSGGSYLYDSSSFGAAPGSNGTNTLLVSASSADYVTITLAGGGLFNLASLTLGIYDPNSRASDSVLINGMSQTVTSAATSYAVNLRSVSSVRVSALTGGGTVSLDNINYQVPEPSGLLLLAAGLAGLTFARRRSRG